MRPAASPRRETKTFLGETRIASGCVHAFHAKAVRGADKEFHDSKESEEIRQEIYPE